MTEHQERFLRSQPTDAAAVKGQDTRKGVASCLLLCKNCALHGIASWGFWLSPHRGGAFPRSKFFRHQRRKSKRCALPYDLASLRFFSPLSIFVLFKRLNFPLQSTYPALHIQATKRSIHSKARVVIVCELYEMLQELRLNFLDVLFKSTECILNVIVRCFSVSFGMYLSSTLKSF